MIKLWFLLVSLCIIKPDGLDGWHEHVCFATREGGTSLSRSEDRISSVCGRQRPTRVIVPLSSSLDDIRIAAYGIRQRQLIALVRSAKHSWHTKTRPTHASIYWTDSCHTLTGRWLTVSHDETSKCDGFEGEKRTEETLSNGGELSSNCSARGLSVDITTVMRKRITSHH